MTSPLAAVAKHFRNRLKAADIKAKCSVYTSCGYSWLRVSTPVYEYEFTAEEQIAICTIAKVNGLTMAQGAEINVNRGTYEHGVHFVVPSTVLSADWVLNKAGITEGAIYA